MYLREEKDYRACWKALDAMNLSEEDRKLAEEYLDPEQAEDRTLLDRVSHQDFSLLDEKSRKRCVSYVKSLQKQEKAEELRRYIQFCVEAGGSTARYTLLPPLSEWAESAYGADKKDLDKIKGYFMPEQAIAVWGEMLVWRTRPLAFGKILELTNSCMLKPKTFYKAIDQYCHHSDNTKILLAGIYLYCAKMPEAQKALLRAKFPEAQKDCLNEKFPEAQKDCLNEKFPEAKKDILHAAFPKAQENILQETPDSLGEENDENTANIIKYLEDSLISKAPMMYPEGQKLTDKEGAALQEFLRKAEPNAAFTGEIWKKSDISIEPGGCLTRLLAGAAFMAMEHSDRFLLFLRYAMYRNLKVTLDVGRNMCAGEWLDTCFAECLDSRMERLEQVLPVEPEAYGSWCVARKMIPPLKRMARFHEDAVRRMLPLLDAEKSCFLLEQVKEANPTLHQELIAGQSEQLRNKMAFELTQRNQTGRTEAMNYLLGKVEIDQLYPLMDQWRQENLHNYNYHNDNCEKLERLRDGEDVSMYRRAVVLEAFSGRTVYFEFCKIYPFQKKGVLLGPSPGDKKQLSTMLHIFDQEKVPIVRQMEFLELMYQNYYVTQKNDFMDGCVAALAEKKEEWTEVIVENAQSGSGFSRFLCLRVMDIYWNEFKGELLSYAADSSKKVRELLVTIYAGHKECEPEILTMLEIGKSKEREMAIQVLQKWGAASYREQLERACTAEKNQKLRDQMLILLGRE